VKFLVMANGFYGDLRWYKNHMDRFDRIICVDGGAGQARRLGIIPDWIVGDMDSISEEDREYMKKAGVDFKIYPAEKDDTDQQLALKLAEEKGAANISVWGGTGSRLDHTFSSLCSAGSLAAKGIDIRFEAPDLTIYIIKNRLVIPGRIGETVSLIVLGEKATGVFLRGFQFPLNNALLKGNWQYAISNTIVGINPVVQVESGILAVFHYRSLP
jgi:thiamine pyrophosphokinase